MYIYRFGIFKIPHTDRKLLGISTLGNVLQGHNKYQRLTYREDIVCYHHLQQNHLYIYMYNLHRHWDYIRNSWDIRCGYHILQISLTLHLQITMKIYMKKWFRNNYSIKYNNYTRLKKIEEEPTNYPVFRSIWQGKIPIGIVANLGITKNILK